MTPDQLSTKTGTPEYDVSEGGADGADVPGGAAANDDEIEAAFGEGRGAAQPPLKIIIVIPTDSRCNIRVCIPSRRDDYEDIDFYREQVEKEERLAELR